VGWGLLLVVLVADLINDFDLFEDAFGDGGVVAVGRVVGAESGEVSVLELSRYHRVDDGHDLNYKLSDFNSNPIPERIVYLWFAFSSSCKQMNVLMKL
jgi:hypothetical protein